MYNYSPMKIRMVFFTIPVFCVFFAIMLSACGTKKPAVSEKEDLVPSVSGPGGPKVSDEPIKPLIDMVFVNGGKFSMGNQGNPRGRRDSSTLDIEWPRHDVTLNDFSIGKYEVTQGEFYEVTGLKPSSHMKNPEDGSPDGWKKLPVESINWYEALVFCNMLSIMEKLKPVYSINGSFDPDEWGEPPTRRSSEWDTVRMDVRAEGYRLPTEAEWEYAARGGAESKGYEYAGAAKENAAKVAWFSVIINKTPVGTIHEVGRKQPNELGLYDMSGNVMEWCWDWLGDYSPDPQDNPTGPPRGLYRVIRGGGWSIKDVYSRVFYRHNNQPHYFGINLGLRVARNN
ncbi:MAG: formylglycine-generating enzyme family protein [Treponema sp.]|nr:formylglycine-generating enzyme family protein [Treponema sp.]